MERHLPQQQLWRDPAETFVQILFAWTFNGSFCLISDTWAEPSASDKWETFQVGIICVCVFVFLLKQQQSRIVGGKRRADVRASCLSLT